MDKVLQSGLSRMAPQTHDDRPLAAAFLAGKAEAIGVVDRWIDLVLHSEFGSQRSQWEDLKQEIRMRVLVNLRERRFRGDSELRTYVHRIARNAAIDAWRRSAAWRRAGDEAAEEAPDSAPVGQERLASRDLLGKILLGLTRDERRLLSLIFLEQLSYAEVAKRLGIHEGAVKVRVFRCRERMSDLRRRLLGLDR